MKFGWIFQVKTSAFLFAVVYVTVCVELRTTSVHCSGTSHSGCLFELQACVSAPVSLNTVDKVATILIGHKLCNWHNTVFITTFLKLEMSENLTVSIKGFFLDFCGVFLEDLSCSFPVYTMRVFLKYLRITCSAISSDP